MNKYLELGGWQESVLIETQKLRKGFAAKSEVERGVRIRVRVLYALLLSACAAVVARLVYFQVLNGNQQYLLSQSNHLEKQVILAERGTITDRNKEPLTENTGSEGWQRKYLLGESAAHLIGYVSQTKEEEIGCFEGLCYGLGQWIGRTGAEKELENVLRGKDGGKLLEVNASQQVVRNLGSNEAEKGQDVVLAVDMVLQKAMASAMKGKVGSAVALDLNGKVLGLFSSPSYDPNLFTVTPNQQLLESLLKDSNAQIFLDRAISGAYAPGSVFKPVVAYAALASGKIKADTLVKDTGEIKLGEYRYGNWYFDQYGKTEGEIAMEKALARSNDIYFYKVGEEIGVDEIIKWAKKFGYGEKTGIELPGESAGLVPSRLWKERVTGEKWFLGNTYHLSIGQGDLTATPLQVGRATAAVISGRLCKVSILRDSLVSCEDLKIPTKDIETVRSGMRDVCSPGGTAFPFFDFTPQVLCKTGTAQHAGQNPSAGSGLSEQNKVKPHAWIVVAYPAENPKLILTVMLEAAGEGSAEAGPVAKQILSQWRDMGN